MRGNKVFPQNSISKDLEMRNYVTILAWKQPFSPEYSPVSDIYHSDEYIVAANCRQVFLLSVFKISSSSELRMKLYRCQVWGWVSAEFVADMHWSTQTVLGFVLLPMLAGDQNVAMGSPNHKNPWSFAAIVSFHFTVWLTFFLLDLVSSIRFPHRKSKIPSCILRMF